MKRKHNAQCLAEQFIAMTNYSDSKETKSKNKIELC